MNKDKWLLIISEILKISIKVLCCNRQFRVDLAISAMSLGLLALNPWRQWQIFVETVHNTKELRREGWNHRLRLGRDQQAKGVSGTNVSCPKRWPRQESKPCKVSPWEHGWSRLAEWHIEQLCNWIPICCLVHPQVQFLQWILLK